MKNSGHKDAMETRLLACHRGLAKTVSEPCLEVLGLSYRNAYWHLAKKGLITQLVINWNTNCSLSFGQKIEVPGMACNLFSLAQKILAQICTA